MKTGLVQGRPWLEDLYRLPKSRLKIEFVPAKDSEPPAELSQESLYSLFRRYGKISDITSQPPDSKILPKFAYVDFVVCLPKPFSHNRDPADMADIST
jgi:hypothetical protein